MRPQLQTHLRRLAAVSLLLWLSATFTLAQITSFTYQGRLTDGGTAANGNYDLQFTLFDSPSGGTQIGATQTSPNVSVSAGIFSVRLDFGATAFPGATRFLEISARLTGTPSFATLSPRQQITSTPYAIRTLSAETADTATNATNATTATNAAQLGGVAANEYVQTNDSRLTDARSPTAGSANYIQNTTTQQASANFNISGNGTAAGMLAGNIVNATTQYNIGGTRVLSIAGTRNTFTGVGAGQANVSGLDNAFFGFNAGLSNNTGARNTYSGVGAGQANVNGHNSAFFGFNAGLSNTGTGGVNAVANFNSFFGANAGRLVTFGGFNSFFGAEAGSNSTGNTNSFFGFAAGGGNSGDDNSFFGTSAGIVNKGNRNSFFGVSAGRQSFFGDPDPPATGDDNSFFGNGAGAHNTASSNSFFGSNAGQLNSTASGNSFFGSLAGTANTTSARNSFFGASAGINTDGGPNNFDLEGADNSFFGYQAGKGNVNGRTNAFFGSNAGLISGGAQNSFFGANAGKTDDLTVNNTFIGYNAGNSNISGREITLIGANANVAFSSLQNATAIGANSLAIHSNSVVLGSSSSVTVEIPGGLNVAGSINVSGTTTIGRLDNAGNFQLCRTLAGAVGYCSSSLRYKTDVRPFIGGLDIINRLRPIAFTWKQGGMRDIGFGAEEVEKVEPLLTFRNDKGEIEGVKYNQLSALFVNAFKEQQSQIETLRRENTALNARLRSVERVLSKRVGPARRRR
jgi:hypothetical protein